MAFPLVSEGVRSSLFFGVYGKVLDLFGAGPHHAASYSAIAVAAAVGGGVQGLAATPVELVKIQLQSPNGQCHPSMMYFLCFNVLLYFSNIFIFKDVIKVVCG